MWTGSFADTDLVKESSLDRSDGDRAETTVPTSATCWANTSSSACHVFISFGSQAGQQTERHRLPTVSAASAHQIR
jgi:hypothetical protein